MVIPVSTSPNLWNSTLSAQETEVADQDMDRTTTLFSYDEGQDLSEDEDGAKQQARKDSLKLQEEAMRCAQSLEDTEGLEEVAMFSDKMLSYGGGFSSFGGYRSAPGDHFLVASSNGHHPDEAEEERLVPASSATSPAWYRGDFSSQCGRGCCGSPWQSVASTKSLLGGVEYVEEELLSAKNSWRASSNASQSSRELVSASGVQSLLVAKLKQRSCVGGDSGGSVSSIVQEILAREISEKTAIALQALEQAQNSS